MANKKFLSGILIMALILGTAIIGCENGTNAGANNGTNNGSTEPVEPVGITYTVTANGKLDEETSTQLTFTFSEAVSDLKVENINIIAIIADTGKAEVNSSIKDNLTGGDTVWKLSITKITAGKIRVGIDKEGIERGRKTLFVYKDSTDGFDQEHAIKLTSRQWEDGSVAAAGDTKWYKFEAEAGTDYRVQWKDMIPGEDYTAWIKVTAYESDGTTEIWTYGGPSIEGYRNPKPVSGVSGTVYLKVEYLYRPGKYAIRFYEPAGLPQVFITVESARATIVPFVAVKWYVKSLSETGEINVSGFRVYRSNTATGTYTQIGEDYSITDFPLVDFTTNDTEKIIYIDKNVTVGNTYWYKVTAYNKDGEDGDLSDPKQSETVTNSTPKPLTIGADETEGAITEVEQEDWYTFEATSGKTYSVQWESAYNNRVGWMKGGYAVVKVSVFTSDTELVNFTDSYGNGAMQGWTIPGTVSGVSGKVYLKVELDQKASYAFGPYTIKVYE